MESLSPAEKHPFPSFVPLGSRYLLIGTFPGRALTQAGTELGENDWYYGTSKHSLWALLAEVYAQPLTTKQEKQDLLTSLQMGITDVVAEARRRRPSNNDSDLEIVAFQTEILAELLKSHQFDKLYFTSQQAQKWFAGIVPKLTAEFGMIPLQLPATQHVLPSPSQQYIRFKHGTVEGRRAYYREHLPKLV